MANPTCLPHEVVGIARDGSLIRNDEAALYGIFDDTVLIGYALDGFPIYGQTVDRPLDQCGGAMVDGSYRYYLSEERDHVLGCYRGGEPITL
jgi:hypothetical protein